MSDPDVGFEMRDALHEWTLDDRIAQAHWLVDVAIHRYVTMKDKTLKGQVVLFSGGNDSTILAHIMRDRATHFGHCNTTIGIEATRQFVRDLAAEWGIPLLEKSPPPGSTYRDLVIDQGFPGPGHHFKMYQRLKERGIAQIKAELLDHPYRERVLFIAGRRRAESQRRQNIPEMERNRSAVWVSPLVHWTDDDMAAYRERFDVPFNEVTAHIHMSGECLCGAFASVGELDEVGFFYPEVKAEIEALQVEVRAAGHPEKKCVWGWGAGSNEKPSESGALCSTCDSRQLELELGGVA